MDDEDCEKDATEASEVSEKIEHCLNSIQAALDEVECSKSSIHSESPKAPFTWDCIVTGSKAIGILLDPINFYDSVYMGSDPKLFAFTGDRIHTDPFCIQEQRAGSLGF